METWLLQLTHVLTPLHNGAGQGLGAIDRPIIREVTTNYPYVQSDSIKGAWKADATNPDSKSVDPVVEAAMGKGETSGFQGCVGFQDAHLLAFPVRSLAGTFAWATSRLVLARLHRWLVMAACGGALPGYLKEVVDKSAPLDWGTKNAIGPSRPPGNNDGDWDRVITIPSSNTGSAAGLYALEGAVLAQLDGNEAAAARQALAQLAAALGALLFDENDTFWREAFRSRLLVLPADVFTHLVTHATQVDPNIRIGERGVTEDGSLRYSEYLPAETMLVNLLHVQPPLGRNGTTQAEVLALMTKLGNRSTYQVGADESKGAGIVRSRLLGVGTLATTIPTKQDSGQQPAAAGGGS